MLALAQHERRWDEALLWHTHHLSAPAAALQQFLGSQSQAPSALAVQPPGEQTRVQECISRCLRRLGCECLATRPPQLDSVAAAAAASLGTWQPLQAGAREELGLRVRKHRRSHFCSHSAEGDADEAADDLTRSAMVDGVRGRMSIGAEALARAEALAVARVSNLRSSADAVNGGFVRLRIVGLLQGSLAALQGARSVGGAVQTQSVLSQGMLADVTGYADAGELPPLPDSLVRVRARGEGLEV